ncbi:MAG TPA: PEP-CTERM sorting domain-containing protein [Acidobacteriota bacterium]|nr:PEP-CTERM sorting domain-containing protein [Acidobacteriota bacterium]
MRRIQIFVIALMLGGFAKADPVELIVNGGFETGDLTGWTDSLNVEVLPTHFGVNPAGGDYMAVLAPGTELIAFLSQGFDPTGFDTAVLSFAINMQSLDLLDIDLGFQFLAVASGSFLQFFTIDDVVDIPPTSTVLGWQTLNIPLPATDLAGPLSINFLLLDFSDEFTTAYVDNVSVVASSVPEPGVVLLLAIGLGTSGITLRKRHSL